MNIANYFQKNQMIAKVEKVQKFKQKSLNLEDFDLAEFPDIILNCDSLRSLILQRNRIAELPKEIGIHLRGLKHLSVQFNNFQSFPECLKELTTLVSLNISHNPIKHLREDIDCFKELKCLWCNSCGLKTIPKSLGNLSKLETFGARNNEIKILPKTITQLKELSWLSLEGNCIEQLPNGFHKLSNLHHLNLNRNHFKQIPKVLVKLKSLRFLHLQRNNIKMLSCDTIMALINVKICLINNPIENGQEFIEFKHLLLNPSDYQQNPTNEEDMITDSSEDDSDWENSTDTLYLNYDSSSQSPQSDEDDEIVKNIPKCSRFFLCQ
ncbi:unnamed protein product [Ceutorhynchus assimilis]|uniref:Leucine-rich repeat protein soc-2 homolog n=1 Tax=Ceutorhynchus assimilis TaxID=467358 RepID=A0A9N9MF43_9CUCU|nr:unnamed protein product [Ceutorhynchus assimilis]